MVFESQSDGQAIFVSRRVDCLQETTKSLQG